MSLTIQDGIIVPALAEIRAARAGDSPAPEDLAFALQTLNGILDLMNAERRAVYTTTFADFTFTPNLSPHTIGPTASGPAGANPSFVVTQRPVSLEYASVNLGGTPNDFVPIRVRDRAWYEAQSVPTLTQTFPTDVYYAQDWQDPTGIGTGYGSLYFYGIPTTAYGVRLWLRQILAQVALTDVFSLPPGYARLLLLATGKACARPFGQTWTPEQDASLSAAMAIVYGNNDDEPTLATADAGLNRSSGQSNFNYRSRSFS